MKKTYISFPNEAIREASELLMQIKHDKFKNLSQFYFDNRLLILEYEEACMKLVAIFSPILEENELKELKETKIFLREQIRRNMIYLIHRTKSAKNTFMTSEELESKYKFYSVQTDLNPYINWVRKRLFNFVCSDSVVCGLKYNTLMNCMKISTIQFQLVAHNNSVYLKKMQRETLEIVSLKMTELCNKIQKYSIDNNKDIPRIYQTEKSLVS